MKKILLLLIFASAAFASSGTVTLETPGNDCFVFSEGKAMQSSELLAQEKNLEIECDILLEPWTKPGWCANYIDDGEVELDSLATPPSQGYNDDAKGYVDCTDALANHAYWIKTRDGKYAKVKITEATFIGNEPGKGNMNRLIFVWEYLGGGTANPPGNNGNTGRNGNSGDGDTGNPDIEPPVACYCAPLLAMGFAGFAFAVRGRKKEEE